LGALIDFTSPTYSDVFNTRVYNATIKDFSEGFYKSDSTKNRDLFLQDVVLQDCGNDTTSGILYNSTVFGYRVSEGKQIVFGVKASSVIESLSALGTFTKSGKGTLLCAGNDSKSIALDLLVNDGSFVIAPVNSTDPALLLLKDGTATVEKGASIILENNGRFSDTLAANLANLQNSGALVVKGFDTKSFKDVINKGVIDLSGSKAKEISLQSKTLDISENNNTFNFAVSGDINDPQSLDKQAYVGKVKVNGALTGPSMTDKVIINVDFNGFAFTKEQEFTLLEADSVAAALNVSNFILNYDDKNYSASLKVLTNTAAPVFGLVLHVTPLPTNEQINFEALDNIRGGTVTLDQQDLVIRDGLTNSGTIRVEGVGQSALLVPVGNTLQPKQLANDGTVQIYQGASLQTGPLENKLGATVNSAGGLTVEGKFVNKGNANLGKVAQR